MVRTYRLGGAERERARALIRILGIDMDRVGWLDGHPMTVRVFDIGENPQTERREDRPEPVVQAIA